MRPLKLGFALGCLLFLQIEATRNGEEANPCPDDSLPCNNGQCVRRKEWCNGQKNCEDESDEAYCKTFYWYAGRDPNRCKETHFLCRNGRCVPRVVKCDGYTDCKDGSDEGSCEPDIHDDYIYTEITPDIQTDAATKEVYSEGSGLENDDLSITSTMNAPAQAFTENVLLSSSTVDFYAKRMEEESGQIDSRSPPPVPYRSSTTPGVATAPERGPNLDIGQNITTPQTPPFTTSPTRANKHPSFLTMQPRHPPHSTSIPNSRNHYAGVTQRVYVDGDIYYDGYYDQRGNFVLLYLSQDSIDPEIPATTQAVFERHIKAPSGFYFAKNYNRIHSDGNISYLRKGREWILSVQNSAGGWGKDTPRAVIALSLINNSFVNPTYDNDMMQKYLQVYLGTRLLRGDAEVTSLNRLAMSVNALMATCQNPRNFYGTDLTDLIQKRLERLNQENQRNRDDRTRTEYVNPAVYLSLCLADRDLTHFQVNDLMTRLNAHVTPGEYSRDMLSLSISAFSCHLRRQKFGDSEYQRSMDSMLSNATTKLLDRMLDDGSFGSVYGTALAAQALLSLSNTKHWNSESTFDFLKEQQKSDGSFGDFLSTYLVLPVLSGRSLLHLRNTQCTPPKSDRDLTPSEILAFSGPEQHVRYSLYFGHPKVNRFSIELLVPRRISFFDIMRVAQHERDAFKFSYEERNGKMYVYSISNIPNDYEQGIEWHLYEKRSSDLKLNKLITKERVLEDIREFYPRSDQHVIFWYHPSDIRT